MRKVGYLLAAVVLVCAAAAMAGEQVQLELTSFEPAQNAWGSYNQGGAVSSAARGQAQTKGGTWSLEWNYDFTKTVTSQNTYASLGIWREIPGAPVNFSLWVYGDGSGNTLVYRTSDAGGQTFQGEVCKLDFTGWKQVTFPATSNAHWGGKNDGKARYPLRLSELIINRPAVLSAANRMGTIYLDLPSAVTNIDESQMLGLEVKAPGKFIQLENRPLDYVATVSNYSQRQQKDVLLFCELTAEEGEVLVAEQRNLRLPPGAVETVQFTLKAPAGKVEARFTAMDASFSASATKSLESWVMAAVPDYATLKPSSIFGTCTSGLGGKECEDLPWHAASGVKWVRVDFSWMNLNPQRGVYNWEWADTAVKKAKENGQILFPILGYTPEWANSQGIRRNGPPDKLEDWTDFVYKVVDRYKDDIRYWELWNEPNISIRGGIDEYARIFKAGAMAVKRADPTAIVSMGGTAGNDLKWIEGLYRQGAGPYIDQFNVHTYQWNSKVFNSKNLSNQIQALNALQQSYGDNKPICVSEIGWTTIWLTEEEQARNLVQLYVAGLALRDQGLDRIYWYNFRDKGNDPKAQEDNWGVITNPGRPKPAFFALKELTSRLEDAVYLARLPLDAGVSAYLFHAPEGLVLAAWTGGPNVSVTLPQAGLTVTDLYGASAPLSGKTAVLSDKPVYISGLSKQVGLEILRQEYQRVLGELARLRPEFQASELATIKEENIAWLFALRGKLRAERGAMQPDLYPQVEQKTDLLLKLLAIWPVLAQPAETVQADSAVEKTRTRIMKSSLGRWPDAEQQIEKAGRFADLMQQRPELATANWKAVTDCYLKEAEQIQEREVALQPVWYDLALPAVLLPGVEYQAKLTVHNEGGAKSQGKLQLKTVRGINFEPAELSYSVEGKAEESYAVKCLAPFDIPSGVYRFTAFDPDRNHLSVELEREVRSLLASELLPLADKLAAGNRLLVRLKNNSQQQLEGLLTLQTPGSLRLESDEQNYSLAPGEEQSYAFTVAESKPVPWHAYQLNLLVDAELGGKTERIVARQEKLNFLMTPKVGKLTIDGELSDWEQNAYPINLNKREQIAPDNRWWNGPEDLSATVYQAYDDEYYYFAAVVKDDMYNQPYSGSAVYDGDGIQMAFDPLLERPVRYNANTYEYGLSLTPDGPEVYRWQAGAGREIGLVRQAELKVIVKEEAGVFTVIYEAAIPFAELAPMNPRSGGYGFNIIFNDNDMTGRDGWIGWTGGIGSSKNPSLFSEWKYR